MNTTPSLDENSPLGRILKALRDEDFEHVAALTADCLDPRKTGDAGADPYVPYIRSLNLIALGYRRWQVSYRYTEVRNYFYAANLQLSRANPVPGLAPAFHAFRDMLDAYTWCENSFINGDPFAFGHYAEEAKKAEDRGIKFLGIFHTTDAVELSLRDWLKKYLEKNRLLHMGFKACAEIYSKILRHESCDKQFFGDQIREANKALRELSTEGSRLCSPELASELNAHICFIRRHYERTNRHNPRAWPTFLRLRQGTVTLCFSAGCEPSKARKIVAGSADFKKTIEAKFRKCRYEMSSFRMAPIHSVFQTGFGSHFLQTLTFDLPPVTIRMSEQLDRSYKFNVQVKLTSLGTCTVYLIHKVERPGLTVEEARSLQSIICPHAGQLIIEIDRPCSATSFVPLSDSKFKERFEFAILDDLVNLEEKLAKGGGAQGSLHKMCQKAKSELENVIGEFSKQTGFVAESSAKREEDVPQPPPPLFECLKELCESSHSDDRAQPGVKLKDRCNQLTYVADFAAWVLGRVREAFLHEMKEEKADEAYESDRRWLFLPDTGWYSYVHAKLLEVEDSNGKAIWTLNSFEKMEIENLPDVPGFLIEAREARASFDDWRFMAFCLDDCPNHALIRSHPCDAFYVSENRSFMFFPDDPDFVTGTYDVTAELMIWLGTALKICERLSQLLVRDVTKSLNNG